MQNLEQLLENFITEALQDKQETIPTLELPSAAIIAERINRLEDSISIALNCLQGGNSTSAIQILKEALK